jgi:hypothetical protein
LATVKEDVSSTTIVNSKPMARINPFQDLRLLPQLNGHYPMIVKPARPIQQLQFDIIHSS